MTEIHEIMLEHLKALRKDVSDIKSTQAEHSRQLIDLRDDMLGARKDILRFERALAALELDTDRIKDRLDITDPETTLDA